MLNCSAVFGMETCNSEEKIDEESGMEGGPATPDSSR